MSKFCLNYIPEIILDTFCCCLKPKEWSNLQSSKLLKSTTTYASCSKVLINNCRLFHCRPKPKEWSYSHFNFRVQSSPKSNLHLVPWPDIQEPIGHWISSSNYKFSTLFELFMAIHGLTNYEFFFFIQYLLHSGPDYSSNFVYNSTGQPEVLHSQQKETVPLF